MDSYENLKKKLEKSQHEEWERGKELEKLQALIENWQYQLPDEFLQACRMTLEGYMMRCTAKSSYHQKRLKKSEKKGLDSRE